MNGVMADSVSAGSRQRGGSGACGARGGSVAGAPRVLVPSGAASARSATGGALGLSGVSASRSTSANRPSRGIRSVIVFSLAVARLRGQLIEPRAVVPEDLGLGLVAHALE